jgi:uncharacterized repeat protein (TIGR03803 family)
MIDLCLGRFALGVCVGVAMLAGCGGGNAPFSPSPAGVTAQRAHVRRAYSLLYSFKGGPDGALPEAGLLNVNGTLYGTTAKGGGAKCKCGTVFTMTPSGTETVLHSFTVGDGKEPWAALVNVNGTLYGTTVEGGAYNGGTVFEVTTSGKETVLHSFGWHDGDEDGLVPHAGLINVNGTLYGTTLTGGSSSSCGFSGCGTVFSITPRGAEKVLHSFGKRTDGRNPAASLVEVNGRLYGTTINGGSHACTFEGVSGCGTVFTITTSGREKVLHRFAGGSDGEHPRAGLIDVKGTLYGTTSQRGANCSPSDFCGTVFSITTSGKETVLYSFKGETTDGAQPLASLIDVKGMLYGTTEDGGPYCYSRFYDGCGTVFSISRSGTENVLHSFGGGSDGRFPEASLLEVNGTLYGTTVAGGADGHGTVFSISP